MQCPANSCLRFHVYTTMPLLFDDCVCMGMRNWNMVHFHRTKQINGQVRECSLVKNLRNIGRVNHNQLRLKI